MYPAALPAWRSLRLGHRFKPGGFRADPPSVNDRALHCVLNPKTSDAQNLDRRDRGRFRCELLRSSLGTVEDISSTGVRVRGFGIFGRKPGSEVLFVLETYDGPIEFRANVIWDRPTGLFRRERGLRFVGMSEETKARLAQVCHTHGIRFALDILPETKQSRRRAA